MTDMKHIDLDHPIESIDSLDNERQSVMNRVIKQKICVICNEGINIDDYAEHITNCDGSPKTVQHVVNESMNLSTAQLQPILNTLERNNDKENPKKRRSSMTINTNTKKTCILCSNRIAESEFMGHMLSCLGSPPSPSSPTDIESVINTPESNIVNNENQNVDSNSSTIIEQFQDCIICSKPIKQSELEAHVNACLSEQTPSASIPKSNSITNETQQSKPDCSLITERLKNCIICSKQIKESELESHVNACLSKQTTSENITEQSIPCFSCHHLTNPGDHLSQEISCPSRHIYCLPCLQQSMEEYARNRLIPLCHPKLCDYQLSQYDISLMPLERRISDRLLKLAKGQQRPECPKCHFYIHINQYEDFYEHVDSCGDLIPCEYCSCPYSIDQLNNHLIECQNDKSSKNDKLINFIVNRIKYPFTKQQIQFFIQEKKKEKLINFDPLSIVNALAVFGPIFPCDMPTKDCDVCMEACSYDDIYVFDCPDSHKLCYSCYYRSCETKMANGEILTCGLCANPLKDGELNQLRISKEEIIKLRNYQIKKTLEIYSNQTRGVIKCPNQNCSWIAEAEDPTERFKVECPICKREFCSLCNQQYHYRTTCQQLPQITQRWFLWCQTERVRYLTTRAQQDATYATRLNEYNRQMNENENRNQELRRRYEDLMNDEQYKAQNCRLCPSCKRVVQRLEGCDKMICGQDAHGGNIQSGCGHKFNWIQAQAYTASATFQAQQTNIDLPKPENPIVHHIGVQCDECQNDVNGIRFDCVHCPSLTYCEKCEQHATLKHAQLNEQMKQQSHVFRLIMTPEEVAF